MYAVKQTTIIKASAVTRVWTVKGKYPPPSPTIL